MEIYKIIASLFIFGIGLYTTLMWKHLESKFKYYKEQYMLLNDGQDKLDKRLSHLETCQHEMETNYIGRFSDIKQDLAENKEEIIGTIHSMENRLRDNMVKLANGKIVS